MMDEGRLQEAVRILDEHLERRSGDVEALKLRGLSKSGLGDFDAAIGDLEAFLNKRPDDAETHLDLGMILALKKKDVRHAMIHLDRYLSLEANPDRSAKTATVMVSLDGARTKRERRATEELLEMAEEFASEGKARVAIRAYEQVLSLHPTCAPCHESLGKLLIRENHREEGERHLAKARLFRHHG
jgi:tetratricopeptide (TPR) repeat protein